MAEVDTGVLANGHTILANEIAATSNVIKDGQVTLGNTLAAIRHDVGLAESNMRGDLGQHAGLINKNVGDNGFRIAAAEANIRDSIGREACGINTNIAAGRAENERGFADTRYNVATEAGALSKQLGAEACGINKHIGDMRQEDAENFGHTRRDVMGTASDIRREQQAGFGDVRYNVAERAGDIRREQQSGFGDVRYGMAKGFDEINDAVRVEGGNTRAQSAAETNEIVKEGLKGDFNTRGDIKDARYDLSSRLTNGFDRVSDRLQEHDTKMLDRFYSVGRDTMDLRAQVTGLGYQVRDGFVAAAKDMELQALKTQLDGKANTQYLADKIVMDGEKTRGLINDLKYHDLNRALVERQTALVNCEQDNRHWHNRYDDARWAQHQNQWGAQFAAMQSQLQSMNQNFNSQLSEARQGMVNFGTMAGVGQSSTNNNVR